MEDWEAKTESIRQWGARTYILPPTALDRVGALIRRGTANTVVFIRDRARPWRIRFEKQSGVRVKEMIDYLEEDAVIFSNFLAAKIPELYSRIGETDKEILRLRGEQPALSERAEKAQAMPAAAHPSEPDAQGEGGLGGPSSLRLGRLAEAEWRAARLGTAAAQLIAFANQKVIEQRFRVLRLSVRYGGAAVIIGVSVFALAPKWAQPSPLLVGKPTKVTIVVKAPGKFGRDCHIAQLSGVAIGGSWDKPVVVSEPSGGCQATRLVLKSSIGLAIPVESSP
jgi:hypothetical protein